MSGKKHDVTPPPGWTVTLHKPASDTEREEWRAIKTVNGVVVSEQHTETAEQLAAACEAYDRKAA